jgi:hypothetical protein
MEVKCSSPCSQEPDDSTSQLLLDSSVTVGTRIRAGLPFALRAQHVIGTSYPVGTGGSRPGG